MYTYPGCHHKTNVFWGKCIICEAIKWGHRAADNKRTTNLMSRGVVDAEVIDHVLSICAQANKGDPYKMYQYYALEGDRIVASVRLYSRNDAEAGRLLGEKILQERAVGGGYKYTVVRVTGELTVSVAYDYKMNYNRR